MSFKNTTKAKTDREPSLNEQDERILFKYVRWRSKGRENVNCLGSLCDGVTLNVLVEEVTGMKLKFNENPAKEKNRKENVGMVLEFLTKIKVDTCKLSSSHILKAERRVLSLLENILKNDILVRLHGSTRSERDLDAYEEFLEWINKRIQPHIQVRNFSDYWISGRALAALVNSFNRDLLEDWLDWAEVKDQHLPNTERAMTEAQKLGVFKWLSPEDMCSQKANKLQNVVYLFQFLMTSGATVPMRDNRGRTFPDDYIETSYPPQQVRSDILPGTSPHYGSREDSARPQTEYYQNCRHGAAAMPQAPGNAQNPKSFYYSTPFPAYPPTLEYPTVPENPHVAAGDGYLDEEPDWETPSSPSVHSVSPGRAVPPSNRSRSRSSLSSGSSMSDFSSAGASFTPRRIQDPVASSNQQLHKRYTDTKGSTPKIDEWFLQQEEALREVEEGVLHLAEKDFDPRRTIFTTPKDERGFWSQLPKSTREEYRAALDKVILDGELRIKRLIGTGVLSEVHEVRFAHPENGYVALAAKRLAGDSLTIQDVMNLLDAARMLRSFKHPRVMSLDCLVFSKGMPTLLLPLQENGNLQTYLKTHGSLIPSKTLRQFCKDIAEGMAYLHDCANVVHRYLCAMNCLLDGDFRVKIDDFVRARETIEQSEYYVVNTEFCKRTWMIHAPEILDPMKPRTAHNFKTDVWSYGLLLCVIYHYGEDLLVFPRIKNAPELVKFFRTGRLMQKPQAMPESIYDLVRKCLSMEPLERPTFKQLFSELDRVEQPRGQQDAFDVVNQEQSDLYDVIDDTLYNDIKPRKVRPEPDYRSAKQSPPTYDESLQTLVKPRFN